MRASPNKMSPLIVGDGPANPLTRPLVLLAFTPAGAVPLIVRRVHEAAACVSACNDFSGAPIRVAPGPGRIESSVARERASEIATEGPHVRLSEPSCGQRQKIELARTGGELWAVDDRVKGHHAAPEI